MSDFSVYTAQQITDWMSQATVASAPTNLYIALFDNTGTEVSGDFLNDRPETAAGTEWDVVGTNDTDFENNAAIEFGEASVDVDNLEDVALFDDTLANGGNEIARYQMEDAPFDVAAGSTLTFNPGDLSFDVIDRTE